MEDTLFQISYETWSQICKMYLYLTVNKYYLQFYPFTKLTEREKRYISSEDFFNLYIKNGTYLLKKENHIVTDGFILKSDNSFRHVTLVSPLLYLVQQAIGKEIWNTYIDERPKEIQVFYSGDYAKEQPLYKKQYDNFCKILNVHKDNFDYFIKTDITDFFSNISMDKLISIIDKKCNAANATFSQSVLQVYKEFITYCGKGKFACTENSIAASFLSTVVYLEEIDKKLYQYLLNHELISSFMLIRYVDDLYILCSFKNKYDNIYLAYRDIFEYYSTLLREYNLTINSKKSVIKGVEYLNEELKQSLYDETVQNIEFEILQSFANNIGIFLDNLIEQNKKKVLTLESYIKLFESSLKIEDIEYSPIEIFNQFTYDENFNEHFPELNEKLKTLFSGNLNFIKYDPKRYVKLLLNTKNEKLIKKLLKVLLNNGHNKKWSIYDSAIAINYLLGRSFVHTDLINSFKNNNPELSYYINSCCLKSFLRNRQNKISEKICSLISQDWKTAFIYYMYCIERAKENYLSAYAYFKNFFDRFTALLAFEIKYPGARKNNKPNFKLFFKEGTHKSFYQCIKNSGKIIHDAHELRNHNPIIHASAELIGESIFSVDIKNTIEKLKTLFIDFMKIKKIY